MDIFIKMSGLTIQNIFFLHINQVRGAQIGPRLFF